MMTVQSLFYIVLMAFSLNAQNGRAEDQRNVAVYDDCHDASCPVFQVLIKHREIASSSRGPGPLVRPVVPAPVPTPIPTPPAESLTPRTATVNKPSMVVPVPTKQLEMTYGLFIASDSVECSKTAIVPNTVFKAITAVLASVKDSIDQGGGAPPAFTPMQQTMLLFYTTIMQQTLNFDCSFSGGALGRSAGGSQ